MTWYATLKTKYEYNNEFELLIINVREVIENMENSRINVVSLISKLMDSQIIVDKLQIGISRDNLRNINNRLVKRYRKFSLSVVYTVAYDVAYAVTYGIAQMVAYLITYAGA